MLNRAIPPRQWAAVTLLAALVFSVLLLRAWRSTRPLEAPSPPHVVVDVVGDVPDPGVLILVDTHRTVDHALRAAGWTPGNAERLIPEGIERRRLETGERVRVSRVRDGSTEVVVEKMDGTARLVLGFKLNVNTASESDLARVPGMKPEWARIIVERRAWKPWSNLDELQSIHGIGARTVEKWQMHLETALSPSETSDP